jgi:alpha-glucosidase
MTQLCDGINADHNAEDYKLDLQCRGNDETLTIHMVSGGGFVLKFGKITVVDHL